MGAVGTVPSALTGVGRQRVGGGRHRCGLTLHLLALVLQHSSFVPALTVPLNSFRLDPLPWSMERDGIGLQIIPKWARACVSRTSRLRLAVCVGAEAEHQPKLSIATIHAPPRTFYCLAEARAHILSREKNNPQKPGLHNTLVAPTRCARRTTSLRSSHDLTSL
jgi:hypothetical protein